MMATEVFFGDAEVEEANLAYQILKSVMNVRTYFASNCFSLVLKTEAAVCRT